jgi:hypothetical protein
MMVFLNWISCCDFNRPALARRSEIDKPAESSMKREDSVIRSLQSETAPACDSFPLGSNGTMCRTVLKW